MGPEFSVIFTHKDLKLQLYPQKLRKRMACRRMIAVVVHILLTTYISILLWAFWRSWAIDCIRQLNEWLSIYFFVEVLHLIERTASVCTWLYANEPTIAESRLFIMMRFWLFILEASWIIYGTSFIYDEEIENCGPAELEKGELAADLVEPLRITTTVLVIYGYILLLWICCGCLLFIYCYRTVQSWRDIEKKSRELELAETRNDASPGAATVDDNEGMIDRQIQKAQDDYQR